LTVDEALHFCRLLEANITLVNREQHYENR
jgi:hypothetical protein